jgi:hypothetical protein
MSAGERLANGRNWDWIDLLHVNHTHDAVATRDRRTTLRAS